MKICGIELKSSDAILSIIEFVNGTINYIPLSLKKLSIKDDENRSEIESFNEKFKNFLKDNNIEIIIIKRRARRGKFAGGAVSFKLEGIIQLNEQCDVCFASSQAISSYKKNNTVIIPDKLLKYQEEAYICALIGIK